MDETTQQSPPEAKPSRWFAFRVGALKGMAMAALAVLAVSAMVFGVTSGLPIEEGVALGLGKGAAFLGASFTGLGVLLASGAVNGFREVVRSATDQPAQETAIHQKLNEMLKEQEKTLAMDNSLPNRGRAREGAPLASAFPDDAPHPTSPLQGEENHPKTAKKSYIQNDGSIVRGSDFVGKELQTRADRAADAAASAGPSIT